MEVLYEYASIRHGVFSRFEASSLGITNGQINTRVKNGSIVRLAPRVYAIAGSPDTWARRARAAALSAGV